MDWKSGEELFQEWMVKNHPYFYPSVKLAMIFFIFSFLWMGYMLLFSHWTYYDEELTVLSGTMIVVTYIYYRVMLDKHLTNFLKS